MRTSVNKEIARYSWVFKMKWGKEGSGSFLVESVLTHIFNFNVQSDSDRGSVLVYKDWSSILASESEFYFSIQLNSIAH